MRRIYESEALHRDDDDPGSPAEREDKPQSARTINTSALSRWIVPNWLRYRAISVSISVPKTEYDADDQVPFLVTMKNSMPFPITIEVRSPLLWTWSVDGVESASHIESSVPEEPSGFQFDRGERKQFRKRWNGMFQIAADEWERADSGEHTISASLNVADAAEKGLTDELTVRIE